jgi:hypothetical protein
MKYRKTMSPRNIWTKINGTRLTGQRLTRTKTIGGKDQREIGSLSLPFAHPWLQPGPSPGRSLCYLYGSKGDLRTDLRRVLSFQKMQWSKCS